ncbi:hypothetical protein PIB30_015847 [Stylosanthes scabra]|uniref:HAT C-terminal dimerisation domain-containing protein n=1 Tax=Stylosanthes scabra TaxID=79078 RepID=A0ABU6R7G3_9FABA|nr:hypothetical protein [Stylosanthes scabra]
MMYEEIDANAAKGTVESVEKKLYKLFEKYDNNPLSTIEEKGTISQPSFVTPSTSSANKKRIFMIGKLMKRNHQAEVSSGKNQLDTYLEKPLLSKECFQDLDVLEWWKLHEP